MGKPRCWSSNDAMEEMQQSWIFLPPVGLDEAPLTQDLVLYFIDIYGWGQSA